MSGLIITVRNGLRQTVVVDVYAESNAPSSSSLPPPPRNDTPAKGH